MICCNEYINLGCYTHCECIYLMDLYADMDGDWQILYSYPGSDAIHVLELTGLLAGDAFAMGNRFNINNTLFIRIRRPDQSYFAIDEIECFRLKNHLQVFEGSLARNQLCEVTASLLDCTCPIVINYTAVDSASSDCQYVRDDCFALQLSVDHVCDNSVFVDFYIDNRKFRLPVSGTIFVNYLTHAIYNYRIEISGENCNTVRIDSTLDLTLVDLTPPVGP